MIPTLPEMTTVPSSPTSAIAPNILAGTSALASPFPQMLENSQMGAAQGTIAAKARAVETGEEPPTAPEQNNLSQAFADLDPIAQFASNPSSVPLNVSVVSHSDGVRGQGDELDDGPPFFAEEPVSRRKTNGQDFAASTGRQLPDGGSILPHSPAGVASTDVTTHQVNGRPDYRPVPTAIAGLGRASIRNAAPQLPSEAASPVTTPLVGASDAGTNNGGAVGTAGSVGTVTERDTTHLPKHLVKAEAEPKPSLPDSREVSRTLPKDAMVQDETLPPIHTLPRPTVGVTSPSVGSTGLDPVPPLTIQSTVRSSDRVRVKGQDKPVSRDIAPKTPNSVPLPSGHLAPSATLDRSPTQNEARRETTARAQQEPDLDRFGGLRVAADVRGLPDPVEPVRLTGALSDTQGPSQSGQTSLQSAPSAHGITPNSPVANTATVSSLSQTAGDGRGDARSGQAIASAIDQLAEARETGRSARPELTMRHQEFGAVSMRIETAGADLRATLASRDPGFVPAVQTALAERTVIAPGETSSAHTNSGRNGDHNGGQQSSSNNNSNPGSQNGSQGHSNGSGGYFEGRYGSSTGSEQGSSKPYLEQSGDNDTHAAAQNPSASPDADLGNTRNTGLFA